MRILGINTATPTTEIALTEGENVVVEKSWPSSRDEAEKILPELQNILQKDATKFGKSLDKIMVINGPGPFTSLRVGVTIANTLGFVFGVPIISSTVYEFFLQKISDRKRENTAVVLKAGNNFFSILMPEAKEPTLMGLNQLSEFFRDKDVHFLAGAISLEDQKNISEMAGISWIEQKDLKTFGQVLKDLDTHSWPEYKQVEPLYLQPPKITQSKKKIFY